MSWQGWLVTVLIDLFILHVLVIAVLRSRSAIDTLYLSFPYVIPAFLFWIWIASKKSS